MSILKIRKGQTTGASEVDSSYPTSGHGESQKPLAAQAAEEIMDFDPYDVFLLPEKRPQTRLDMVIRVTGVALFAIMLLGGGYSLLQGVFQFSGNERHERPFAYFEIKAIDAVGHPVVGAMVEGEEKYGVTDTFGEWRRFMRVRLGSTFRIKITKKTRDGLLVADKNIAIPPTLPNSGDLEIKLAVSVDYRKPGEPLTSVNRQEKPGQLRADADSQQVAKVQSEPAVENTAKPVARYDKVWFEMVAADDPGSGVDAKSRGFLENKVMKALKERVIQLGLRLDPGSAWVLQIRHLSTKGQAPKEGLIHVQSSMAGPSPAGDFSFLRNYKDTAMETARGILWAATLHTENQFAVKPYGERWLATGVSNANLWREQMGTILVNADNEFFDLSNVAPVQGNGLLLKENSLAPCGRSKTCILRRAGLAHRAPQAGWSALHMKIVGNNSPDLEVFVSGFKARKIAPGSYVYWGERQGAANVTVVQSGTMLHRARLKARSDSPARLLMGRTHISKK